MMGYAMRWENAGNGNVVQGNTITPGKSGAMSLGPESGIATANNIVME